MTRYRIPPLASLRAFEAAARHESFTAAAQELHLSQAAVSHQVRVLEQYLGFTLFERLPRSLRLTESGRAYLPSVRSAFETLSDSTVGLFGALGTRSLIIRAPVSYSVLWLTDRLDDFTSRYPDIEIRLSSTVWADALPNDDIDIDIRFGPGNWTGYRTEHLVHEEAVLIASPDCLNRYLTDDGTFDLMACPHIHTLGFEEIWPILFKHFGIKHAHKKPALKVDTSLATLNLVQKHIGCGIVARSFIKPLIAAGDVIVVGADPIPMPSSHLLVFKDSLDRIKPEAKIFRDWLIDQHRKDV